MDIVKDKNSRTMYYVATDLLLIKDNKILLQRRKNTGWNDGKWNLVGGHIENTETLKQCVTREAKEELGIELDQKHLQLFHCTQYKSNRLTIQFYLACTKWKGEPKIQLEIKNGEIVCKADKLEWFEINNLPKDIIPTAKNAIKAFIKKQSFSSFGF